MAQINLKEALLNAAELEFHEHGYAAASVATIAARAKAPKGSVYNHFTSKESMALAALQRYAESRVPAFDDDDSSPPDRIRAYFAWMTDDLALHSYAQGCMLGNFANETSFDSAMLRDDVIRKFSVWANSLALEIGRLHSDWDADSCYRAAQFLINTWEGAALRAKVLRNREAFDLFEELALEPLLRSHHRLGRP